jgi:hypothetical protein
VIEEVRHGAGVLGQHESLHVQAEPPADGPPVADWHAVRFVTAGIALDSRRDEPTVDP